MIFKIFPKANFDVTKPFASSIKKTSNKNLFRFILFQKFIKNKIKKIGISKKNILLHTIWRDGRVVDCGGLENRCTERYRGFESLSLRSYGCSSVGRALVSKTRCRAFESLLPCRSLNIRIY